MSVIVKRLKSNTMEVYVKGAPEVMGDICEKDSCMAFNPAAHNLSNLTTPRAVPQDYDDLLSYYTRAGYRVIAVAGKSIEGLSWLKAQRMKRCDSPSLLHFRNAPLTFSKRTSRERPSLPRIGHLREQAQTGNNACYSLVKICSPCLPDDHR